MKKLLSVSVLVLLSFSLHAFPAIIYRCRFMPYNCPCLKTAYLFNGDGTSTTMDTSGATTYTITGVASVELISTGDYPACCGAGTSPNMGYTWQEYSQDGGVTWGIVSPTFVPVKLPQGSVVAFYWVSGGTLTSGQNVQGCQTLQW